MVWVRPGLELVFTRFLRPNNELIREDLPTLERPANAISGGPGRGYWAGFTALVTNSADLTFMRSKESTPRRRGFDFPPEPVPYSIIFSNAPSQSKVTLGTLAHLRHFHFLRYRSIRSIPSAMFSRVFAYENRRYPSALGPKSTPGVTPTWA
jgi:hypothetical protein